MSDECYIIEEFMHTDDGWVEANSPFSFDDYVEALHEIYKKSKSDNGVYRLSYLVGDDDSECTLIYHDGEQFKHHVPGLHDAAC